jgi:hypothetical protein
MKKIDKLQNILLNTPYKDLKKSIRDKIDAINNNKDILK